MLLYFLKGSLPWQNIKAKSKKEKYDMIKEMKRNFNVNEFCNDVPGLFFLCEKDLKNLKIEEFIEFLKYCRSLKFDDRPDYFLCKNLFKTLMVKNEFQMDYNYDWIVKSLVNRFGRSN